MLGVHPYTYMIQRETTTDAGEQWFTVLVYHGDTLKFRGRRKLEALNEVLEDPDRVMRFIEQQGLDMT